MTNMHIYILHHTILSTIALTIGLYVVLRLIIMFTDEEDELIKQIQVFLKARFLLSMTKIETYHLSMQRRMEFLGSTI